MFYRDKPHPFFKGKKDKQDATLEESAFESTKPIRF